MQTTTAQRIDERGSIEIDIDGSTFDLSKDRFQAEYAPDSSEAFHLHDGSKKWHMNGHHRVTIAEAIELLPHFAIINNGWLAIEVDGSSYNQKNDSTEIEFFINNTLVDPETYRLQSGDHLDVRISTDASKSIDTASDSLNAAGNLAIRINGKAFDLSQDRFQVEHSDQSSLAFHLHDGDDKWYMEGSERITFGEGIDSLPHFSYAREKGDHVLSIDQQTYNEQELGTDLAFFVNDDIVNPVAWNLRDGDNLAIEVTTA